MNSFSVQEILKNDNRSLVVLVKHYNNKYILKIPREKNRRKWIQLTTLYRNSEVKKNFLNLLKLRKLDFTSNLPLLYGEKRRKGRVVDSFILYSYLAGEKISTAFYPKLFTEIRKLHEKGYLHGDFHSSNFLVTNGQISFLDTAFRVNILGKLGCCYEMIYFERNNRTDSELLGVHRQFVKDNYGKRCLFLASCWYDWLSVWRSIKRLLRKR